MLGFLSGFEISDCDDESLLSHTRSADSVDNCINNLTMILLYIENMKVKRKIKGEPKAEVEDFLCSNFKRSLLAISFFLPVPEEMLPKYIQNYLNQTLPSCSPFNFSVLLNLSSNSLKLQSNIIDAIYIILQ